MSKDIAYLGMPAKWGDGTKQDAAAGFRRNQRMLERFPGALVLAFPMGKASGTRDCVERAKKLDHPVWVYASDGTAGFPGASK